MREELRQVLHKQGYGTVGEHVGVSTLRGPSLTEAPSHDTGVV